EWYYLKRLCHSALHTLVHDHPVVGVAYNRDGKRLASVVFRIAQSKEGLPEPAGSEVILWDLEKGKPTHRLPIAWAGNVTLSPDGKLVAAGNKVWDAATAKELCTLEVTAFHPEGKRIAVIDGKTVKLCSALTGQEEGPKFQPHDAQLTSVAFS